MTLQERLLQYRAAHNLSQHKMAKLLNVATKNYQKWENGTSVPRAVNMYRIDQLLKREQNEKNKLD